MNVAKIRLSCDDAGSEDLRLARLCKKYSIDCTFFWPVEKVSLALDNGYSPLSLADAYEIADDFEVGSHTLTHRHLTKVDITEAEKEVWESKIILMKMFDQPIKKFCYPRGYNNPDLDALVLKHYDSFRLTSGIDDEGYKLVHVHPNSGANQNKKWQDCISEKTHLWMHSWELSKYSLWEELEEVLRGNS